MNRRSIITVALVTVTGVCSPVNGDQRWWQEGHQHTTNGAVQHLPEPLRGFFEDNANTIANYSSVEPPDSHWIDIDYYPEFFEGTLPHDYDDLVAIYGESTVESMGTAPWTVGTYTDALSALMASATTANDWLNLRETAGALAHYIEDLHNPLHLTMNYNGQLSGNYGIHSRYEGEMIERHLPNDLPIAPNPAGCMYHDWIVDDVFDSIDVNYWYVDAIMAADDIAAAADHDYGDTYYVVLWQNTNSFTPSLMQDASEMVAIAWYTAWIDAGAPLPKPEPAPLELFETCLSGPDMPAVPGCATVDQDEDGDTDLADLWELQAAGG